MSLRSTEEKELQAQIQTTTERLFSTADIEERIAKALLTEGVFNDNISSSDLEVILRNIVFVLFSRQTVAGRDLDILHNVPIMNVEIDNDQAKIDFVVHIHKPVIVFLEFEYVLVNHDGEDKKNICLKEGSLRISERTRRFDVKAKAAMKAMNVHKIARQEMADLTQVIRDTLPDQLRKKGVEGEIEEINLQLNKNTLGVKLKGEFLQLSSSDFPQFENSETVE